MHSIPIKPVLLHIFCAVCHGLGALQGSGCQHSSRGSGLLTKGQGFASAFSGGGDQDLGKEP